jgi:hypothetical protein
MAPPVSHWPVEELTVDERLALLGRVWDSLIDAGPPPVPGWHVSIIRERIAAADANPNASIPAEDLFRELLGDES